MRVGWYERSAGPAGTGFKDEAERIPGVVAVNVPPRYSPTPATFVGLFRLIAPRLHHSRVIESAVSGGEKVGRKAALISGVEHRPGASLSCIVIGFLVRCAWADGSTGRPFERP